MSHFFWERLVIVAVVITAASLVAKAVDWRIARLELEPGQVTRYRVLRKSIFTGIVCCATDPSFHNTLPSKTGCGFGCRV